MIGGVLLPAAATTATAVTTAIATAIAALTAARQVENAQVPLWQIDLQLANVYRAMGDLAQAEMLATQALAAAPPSPPPQ